MPSPSRSNPRLVAAATLTHSTHTTHARRGRRRKRLLLRLPFDHARLGDGGRRAHHAAVSRALLPIVHSSAEELATYLWRRILETFSPEELTQRGVIYKNMESWNQSHQADGKIEIRIHLPLV